MGKLSNLYLLFCISIAIFLSLYVAPMAMGIKDISQPTYEGRRATTSADYSPVLTIDRTTLRQQLNESVPPSGDGDATPLPSLTAENAQSVLSEQIIGFGPYVLGTTDEAVVKQVEQDELFDRITANSISTDLTENSILLLATGTDHISEAYFQFDDGALVVITLFIDASTLSYHSLLSSFIEKYGDPVLFSPSLVRWQSVNAQLELENPNIVKYADRGFLASRIESSKLRQSDRFQKNQEVINLF